MPITPRTGSLFHADPHGLPLGGKPGRERPLVPPAHDYLPAIARELVGEILAPGLR
jgi:hypothetical protein